MEPTYHLQYTTCGKLHCKKCQTGQGHGPYWYAYQKVDGRTVRKYVGTTLPSGVQVTSEPTSEHRQALPRPLTPTVRIFTLGQLRLERRTGADTWQLATEPAWQRGDARRLLCYLLSSPRQRSYNSEQVIEALWPDREDGRKLLERALQRLQQVFSPQRGKRTAILSTTYEMITLAPQDDVWIDADAFEQFVVRAHAIEDHNEKERQLQEAVTLYNGDFLPEEHKLEGTLMRRETLHRHWVSALLTLSDLQSTRHAFSSAIEALDRVIAADPINEAAIQRLLLLLTHLGRRGEALLIYKRLTTVLQQENGFTPLPETQRVYQVISDDTMLVDTLLAQITQSRGQQVETHTQSTLRHAPSEIPIGRAHQSPLVGREQEIAVLRTLVTTTEQAARFRQVVQEHTAVSSLDPQHRAQCIVLLGDIGIGKTRLAEEVSRDARKRGWSVIWSRIYAQEGNIPYRLWTEVIRKAMEQGIWQQQEIRKRPLVFQSLSALLPEVHDLLNVTYVPALSPEQEQFRLWEAVRELLTIMSTSTPLLIALDDLQWSDSSSCELLAYLARRMHGLPIVIVGTCRDNELGTHHPLYTLLNEMQREHAVACVSLERLSDEQIASLVSQVPHVSEPLVPRISTRAAGNPFFAEELARTVGSPSSSVIASELTGEDLLPDTITSVLDLRLARLSNACQRLLSKAAVLGSAFEFSIICAMC